MLKPGCVYQDVDMPRLWAQLIGAGASEAPKALSLDPGMDVDSEGELLVFPAVIGAHSTCFKFDSFLHVCQQSCTV